MAYSMIKVFYETLTNDIVSFEHLGPEVVPAECSMALPLPALRSLCFVIVAFAG